jgi:thioredoxin-like negative regulator of GroEL
MIERFVIGMIVLGLIASIGLLLRWRQQHRIATIVSTRSIGSSANGAPQILSFYGPGCGACVTQKRVLEQLQQSEPGGLSVRLVDAVAECDLALELGVIVVPTTVVARPSGDIVSITSGLVTSDQLSRELALAS